MAKSIENLVDKDLSCEYAKIRYLVVFYATPHELKQRRIIKFRLDNGKGIVIKDELYPEDEHRGDVIVPLIEGLEYAQNVFSIYSKALNYMPSTELVCPEFGEFVGYKIAMLKDGSPVLVKLVIPANAKRTSAFFSTICRCEWAKVMRITSLDEKMKFGKCKSMVMYKSKTKYVVGNTVKADWFDDDRTKECSNGIHFFMSKEEAIDYYIKHVQYLRRK